MGRPPGRRIALTTISLVFVCLLAGVAAGSGPGPITQAIQQLFGKPITAASTAPNDQEALIYDAASDSIKFGTLSAAAGATSTSVGAFSGWNRNVGPPAVVRLNEITDRIGIGTTTPSNNAKVEITRSAGETWATGLLVSTGDVAILGSGAGSLRLGAAASATGSNGTALGDGASVATSSVAVGRLSIATGENQFVAGSGTTPYADVWFGQGVSHATPLAYTIHGTGGIGAGVPGALLRLAGGLSGDAPTQGGDLRLAAAGPGSGTTLTDVVYVTAAGGNGRVGIGDPPGAFTLDVVGTARIQGKLTVTGALDPTMLLLSGGDKRLGATDAGPVYLAPFADSTTGVQVRRADNTGILINFDTSSSPAVVGALIASGSRLSSTATDNNSGDNDLWLTAARDVDGIHATGKIRFRTSGSGTHAISDIILIHDEGAVALGAPQGYLKFAENTVQAANNFDVHIAGPNDRPMNFQAGGNATQGFSFSLFGGPCTDTGAGGTTLVRGGAGGLTSGPGGLGLLAGGFPRGGNSKGGDVEIRLEGPTGTGALSTFLMTGMSSSASSYEQMLLAQRNVRALSGDNAEFEMFGSFSDGGAASSGSMHTLRINGSGVYTGASTGRFEVLTLTTNTITPPAGPNYLLRTLTTGVVDVFSLMIGGGIGIGNATPTTAGQVQWGTALGSIPQLLGPSDQPFRVESGTGQALWLRSASNANVIADAYGTGVVSFQIAGMGQWRVDNSGDLTADMDNADDVGAAAGNRPRTVYAGTSFNVAGKGILGPLGTFTIYRDTATDGAGVVAVREVGRLTDQAAAVAAVTTYTTPAADGSYEITANVQVTSSTTHDFSVIATYTDETGTERVTTLVFQWLNGTTTSVISNAAFGVGPYPSVPLPIRAKASTTITVATTGMFTAVNYHVEAAIKEVS